MAMLNNQMLYVYIYIDIILYYIILYIYYAYCTGITGIPICVDIVLC